MAATQEFLAGTERRASDSVAARPQIARRRGSAAVVKRGIDVVGAFVGLVVLAPLLFAVAAIVAVDSPGPILFRQRRYGRGLAPFTIFKFRTMQADASPDLHRRHFASLVDESHTTIPGRLHKVVDDPRLTRSGRLLRKLSLDELPQLYNVLRGDMSLVGPRPAIGYELDHYNARDFDRFAVRPGMTGLWQVSGRNELGVREMLELDVRYVRECSLGLDLRILARTPRAAVRGSA